MATILQTPLMKQYFEMKSKYPDRVLLFRVGDFYETFKDDAETVSAILGITLTRRANGKNNYVYLAGFPNHALVTYLPKLIRFGCKVAICEEANEPNPAFKTVKHLIKRKTENLKDIERVTIEQPKSPERRKSPTNEIKTVVNNVNNLVDPLYELQGNQWTINF